MEIEAYEGTAVAEHYKEVGYNKAIREIICLIEKMQEKAEKLKEKAMKEAEIEGKGKEGYIYYAGYWHGFVDCLFELKKKP